MKHIKHLHPYAAIKLSWKIQKEIFQPWFRDMLLPPLRRECPFLCLTHLPTFSSFSPTVSLIHSFLHAVRVSNLSLSLSRTVLSPPPSPTSCLTCWDTCKFSTYLLCTYVSKQFLLSYKDLIYSNVKYSISLWILLDSLLSHFPLIVFFSSSFPLSNMSFLHVFQQIHWLN